MRQDRASLLELFDRMTLIAQTEGCSASKMQKGSFPRPAALEPSDCFLGERTEEGLGLYQKLLDAIATHRVTDQPDRYEPRLKKCRRNDYGWLTKPRAEIKRNMTKGVGRI